MDNGSYLRKASYASRRYTLYAIRYANSLDKNLLHDIMLLSVVNGL
jgi:hypothetical protein